MGKGVLLLGWSLGRTDSRLLVLGTGAVSPARAQILILLPRGNGLILKLFRKSGPSQTEIVIAVARVWFYFPYQRTQVRGRTHRVIEHAQTSSNLSLCVLRQLPDDLTSLLANQMG